MEADLQTKAILGRLVMEGLSEQRPMSRENHVHIETREFRAVGTTTVKALSQESTWHPRGTAEKPMGLESKRRCGPRGRQIGSRLRRGL